MGVGVTGDASGDLVYLPGVNFGRTGQAILKSLQRLRVDPMEIYGTNCFKYEGEGDDEADRGGGLAFLKPPGPHLL